MQGIGVWFQGCGPHLGGYVPGTAHPAGSGSPAKESGEKEDGVCVLGTTRFLLSVLSLTYS